MKIFITKHFLKWSKKNKLERDQITKAANEITKGYLDADLGGGIIKKRVATKGRGKRASARTIVAFKQKHHCFFIYGFEKNEKGDITTIEEKALKLLAKELFTLADHELKKRVNLKTLYEVSNEQAN